MGRRTVASIAIVWLIPISVLVNRIVPDPYMDEIFHIPQVQQYCRGNFRSWDPMITTPPGLYFLSLAYVASLFPGLLSLQTVSSFSDTCSTPILRFTNAVLSLICSILIFEVIKHLRPSIDDKKATFQSVVLSLYPLHWFFAFLYYTDVASLTAVLVMYLLTLKKKPAQFLAKSEKKMWIVVYCLACAATLIPAPLIEFQYYTIPFYFLILHTPINDNKSWLLIGVLSLSINCFTMYMFLFRPFSWNHEAGTQRFIW